MTVVRDPRNEQYTIFGRNFCMQMLLEKNEADVQKMQQLTVLKRGWFPDSWDLGRWIKEFPGGYQSDTLEAAYDAAEKEEREELN